LTIAKLLITEEKGSKEYTREELTDAIRPVTSIISKCTKAQQKLAEGNSYHTRFQKLINAMEISKALITEEITKRDYIISRGSGSKP